MLKGKPAGCKTTVLERLKRWYETPSPGAERMTFVDAQTRPAPAWTEWLLDGAEQEWSWPTLSTSRNSKSSSQRTLFCRWSA